MRRTIHTPFAIGFVVFLGLLVGVWVTVSAARVSSELEALEIGSLNDSRRTLNEALSMPENIPLQREAEPIDILDEPEVKPATATTPKEDVPPGPSHSMHHAMFTKEDVSKHHEANDCWVIMNGLVYNITAYVSLHPGGKKSITKGCGTDVTASFSRVSAHDGSDPAKLLTPYFLGMVH